MLIAREKTSGRAQAEDRENVGHVMDTAGHHGGCGSTSARAHERSGMPGRKNRNEQSKAQNGIQSSLYPKPKDDRDHIPAVTYELGCGIFPTLSPCQDAQIDACYKRRAKEKSEQGNQRTLQIMISIGSS